MIIPCRPLRYRFGVLSTVSVRDDTMGLPLGAVVEYAIDALGRPIFAVSSLSPHCNDLQEDKRASLTVMAPGFKVGIMVRGVHTALSVHTPECEA